MWYNNLFLLIKEVPIYPFDLTPYSQKIYDYLPAGKQDHKPLLSPIYQQRQWQIFLKHFVDSGEALSPWAMGLVKRWLLLVYDEVLKQLHAFECDEKQHYGAHFQHHGTCWLQGIKTNMHLTALQALHYQSRNRAITIRNTYVRRLPTSEPDFYHFTLPGQGFPFDNLQHSMLDLGTPIYIVSTTQDKTWALVLTPYALMGWIKTPSFSYVTASFVEKWQKFSHQAMMGITDPMVRLQNTVQSYDGKAYIGAMLPLAHRSRHAIQLWIPIKQSNGFATCIKVHVISTCVQRLPIAFTVAHMRDRLKNFKNRAYGWGGMFFHNDCSLEMQRLFALFGLWIPRYTRQLTLLPHNISLNHQSLHERINYLKHHGKPLLTLIHIKGHVMLYVGTKSMPPFQGAVITYQNVWGLSPVTQDKRFVIGQSVFLPLLDVFPNDPTLQSQANQALFAVSFLDQLPRDDLPEDFVLRYLT